MKAIRIRTEYLLDPFIDIRKPRLFWNIEGGVTQKGYEIEIKKNEKETIHIPYVTSSRMSHVLDLDLESRDIIEFRIRLYDENNVPGEWSEPSHFEMGLLHKEDFKAHWIKGQHKPKKKTRYPVDCFRHVFEASHIVKARAYITACGLYEANLNGKRIGSFVLAPGYTDYRKRIQYQVYDILGLIQDGRNVLEVELADGWYCGSTGAWGLKNQYGNERKLYVQIELTDEEGNVTQVLSDSTWDWSDDGERREADNKDGEIVDANLSPSYASKARIAKESILPTLSNNVLVEEHEHLKPKLIITPSGKKVLDFSQNIAGYLSFRLHGKKGQKIVLRAGEMLEEGEFSQRNIQLVSKKKTSPLQRIQYTFKEGENIYKTKFAVFGFQYVLVESEVDFRPEDFTAIAVYSSLEDTLSFDSSNPLLNQFVRNTRWSCKNNSLDIPTDCPTRERHGWTGDAQIFFNTAGYLFLYAPFTRKYYQDMLDEQKKDGCFLQISPKGGTDFYMSPMNGSPGWSDAGVFLPYRMYRLFGDRRILEENYEAMKRYARFVEKRCHKFTFLRKPIHLKGNARKYLINYGQSYGEWSEPKDVCSFVWTDFVKPHPEVSTALASYLFSLMKEISALLGKKDDEKEFETYQEGTKEAYQALVRQKDFSLDTDRQARLVRPLYYHLLEENDEEYAKKRLIEALDHYGWKIGTGFLSTPLILYVLESIHPEYAYRLLENEEVPGWLVMPKVGATSVWEGWEGTTSTHGNDSLNHYSKGAVLEWVFTRMCGIQVRGENHFQIQPIPGGHFTFASLTYQSLYGKVSSSWKKIDDQYHFEITIPPNCTATILLPDGSKTDVSSGNYRFRKLI